MTRVLLVGILNWHGRFTESCSQALSSLDVSFELAETANFSDIYELSFLKKIRNRISPYIKPLEKEYPEKIQALEAKVGEGFDLIIILGGDHLSEQTLRRLRGLHRGKLVIWLYDDPFLSWCEPPVLRPGLLSAKDCFDHTFIFDSYHIPKLKAWGFQNVVHLPLCADVSVYHSVAITDEEREKYQADVVFIGGTTPNREEALLQCLDFKLKLFGPSWNDAKLQACAQTGFLPGSEVAKIYQAASIAININHPQSIYGSNCRTFEAPASGCICLTDRKKDVEAQFIEDEEILFYDSLKELPGKIHQALQTKEALLSLTQKGQERVLNEHTFKHRIEKILATAGLG